jgi:DHA1 family tetracycline resistance protein-like MFS transporter
VKARSPLAPIFLIVLVDVLSLTIMIPLLPFYAKAFGASDVTVGFLFAIYSACQLISGPILGNLSDRFGRRPLLLVSQAGMVASLLTLAFATHLWALFVGRIISGFTAGNLTIAQAYITDHTKPDQRTRAFGIIGIAFGVGFALGPAMAGVLTQVPLVSHHSDDLIRALARPLFVAAGLSVTSFITTFILLRPKAAPVTAATAEPGDAPPPAGRRLGIFEWGGYVQYFKRDKLPSLLVQFFLFSVAFSAFFSSFALFVGKRFGWGTHETGYLYAYAGFLGILIQGGLLRRLSKKYGDAPLVIAGFAFATVGYFLAGVAMTVTMLVIAVTVASFGQGFLRPALTARITQVCERGEQGTVLGLTQAMQALAQVMVPPLAALLIQHDQLFALWTVASAVSALALAVSLRSR